MGKDKKNKSSGVNLSYTQQLKWNKQEKAFWAKYFNIPPAPESIPTEAGVLSFRSCDITDSDIGFLTGRVKSIEALELDDADISNEAIEYLTRLEHLGELRLKGCSELDNDCVPALTQLNGIKLLHLGGTEITLEGLRGMHTLTHLEKLFISADAKQDIAAKMQELKEALPLCNFYINHTLYEFDEDER